MRVLVTGSSGLLGHSVARSLASAGHAVAGIDLAAHPSPACPTLVDDLLDRFALHRALALLGNEPPDAIVHTANHVHANVAPHAKVFTDNCRLNNNVFATAMELRIRRLVFISSVQAMIGGTLPDGSINPAPPHELPISEAIPCRPTNVYALSKRQAECTLDEIASPLGYDAPFGAVSLRLPYVLGPEAYQRNLEFDRPVDFRWGGNEVFAYVHVEDAAHAVRLALEGEGRGHEVYWCAAPDPRTPQSVRALAEAYYAGVPGVERAIELDSFNDCSKARERLGWSARRVLRHDREKLGAG